MVQAIQAAWPDMLVNLQAAYSDLINTRFDLERRATELQQAHDLLEQVIASMSEGLFLLDVASRIVQVNPAGLKLLGVGEAEAVGRPLAEFFPNPDVPASAARILAAEPEGIVANFETDLHSAGRGAVPVSLSASVMRDRRGKITGALLVARDVTERKRAEAALRRAHDELEHRVEQRTAELSGANIALAQEVLERQRAEEQLRQSHEQLRALSARIHEAREEERTRIAREIHDELGGNLTAIKIDVTTTQKSLVETQAPLKQRLAGTIELIDDTVMAVRRIAADLRPGILDDFGLLAALDWQLQEFSKRTGLEYRLESRLDWLALDRGQSTAVFRVFQETLTNVARHAQATEVVVTLEQTTDQLRLRVRDNGRGIRERDLAASNSLGLAGMRERVHLLGGELSITGTPGIGTTVDVRIPVASPAASDVLESPPAAGNTQPNPDQDELQADRGAGPGSETG